MKPITRLLPIFVFAVCILLSFGAVAHAASAVEPADGSLLDLLKPVLTAFQTGQYAYAGALALIVTVALVRRYGEAKYPWFGTDAGSAALVFTGALGTSCAASWSGGTSPTWASLWNAAGIALAALGGYAAIKKLFVEPYLTKLAAKGPAWLHKPAALILWIFQEVAPDRAPAPAAAPAAAAPAAAAPAAPVAPVAPAAPSQTGTGLAAPGVASANQTAASSPATTVQGDK